MNCPLTRNGWTYDPVDRAWFARVKPNRWLIAPGEPTDPPRVRPERLVHRRSQPC